CRNCTWCRSPPDPLRMSIDVRLKRMDAGSPSWSCPAIARRRTPMDARATVLNALSGGPKQFDRLLRLHTPLGADVLVAESLDGVESLAPAIDRITGFRLELTALSVDAHIDIA